MREVLVQEMWLVIGCFTVNIFFQIFFMRFLKVKSVIKSVVLAFGLGLLMFLSLESLGHAPFQFAAANILIYGSLGYFYLNIVMIGEASVRVRVLRELATAPQGLTLNELRERYSAKHIVDLRLARLLASGEIQLRAQRYFLARKRHIYVGKAFRIARRFVKGAAPNAERS